MIIHTNDSQICSSFILADLIVTCSFMKFYSCFKFMHFRSNKFEKKAILIK